MKIKLEYGELDQLVRDLGVQEEAFVECVHQMEALIGSIPEAWEGNAAKAYEQQFQELKPSFESTRSLIEGMQSQIQTTMKIMHEKDEALANKLDF